MVLADDFLTDNYLSTDRRIPVTLLQTNACSPLATNALGGNIWDNFSSQTYKDLPSVGKITVHNPIDGSPWEYEMPAGGRGYTRVPSLISLWSTAPFLLNNSVGKFNSNPRSKRAWIRSTTPSKRCSGRKSATKIRFSATRCRASSIARPRRAISKSRPDFFAAAGKDAQLGRLAATAGFPGFLAKEGIEIGPIPKGTPVSLLTNIDLDTSKLDLVKLLLKMKADLKAVEGKSEQRSGGSLQTFGARSVESQQMPGLRRQQGPLFWYTSFRRRAGAERRRQTRADRILENFLTARANMISCLKPMLLIPRI